MVPVAAVPLLALEPMPLATAAATAVGFAMAALPEFVGCFSSEWDVPLLLLSLLLAAAANRAAGAVVAGFVEAESCLEDVSAFVIVVVGVFPGRRFSGGKISKVKDWAWSTM